MWPLGPFDQAAGLRSKLGAKKIQKIKIDRDKNWMTFIYVLIIVLLWDCKLKEQKAPSTFSLYIITIKQKYFPDSPKAVKLVFLKLKINVTVVLLL